MAYFLDFNFFLSFISLGSSFKGKTNETQTLGPW